MSRKIFNLSKEIDLNNAMESLKEMVIIYGYCGYRVVSEQDQCVIEVIDPSELLLLSLKEDNQ